MYSNLEKIEKLEILKSLCDDTERQIEGTQDDSELINLLDTDYKLSAKSKKDIMALVKGKKKVDSIDANTKKELLKKLKAECIMCDINAYVVEKGKNKFAGFEMIKKRIAQKKSNLKSKMNNN